MPPKETSEILEEFQKLGNKIDDLACQDEVLAELKLEQGLIRKALYGNGDLSGGLIGIVNRHDTWIKDRIWYERLVVAAVVAEAVATIAVLAKLAVITNGDKILWILHQISMMLSKGIF